MSNDFSCRSGGVACQAGQALVESLVALLAIAVLWVAVHWLAHYQDMALSATHAGGYSAFMASRDVGVTSSDKKRLGSDIERFFTGSAHRWTDRRGQAQPAPETSVLLSRDSHPALSMDAQPGGRFTAGSTLRRDWLLEDGGVLQAHIKVLPGFHKSISNEYTYEDDASLLKLGFFDLPYPVLTRSTSILVDAGHADSDGAVQERLGASGLAWASAHARSRQAGREVALRAAEVDSAWGRADPEFDWLHPWSGRVPAEFIHDHEGG